jgi:formate dehydrogenase (coenzyme F420) beta subunit
MSIFARAPQTGEGALAGARSVLHRLLETQSVSGVVVDVAGGGQAIPHRRLVHAGEQIERSLPLAPVMLASGARLATQVTDRRVAPDAERSLNPPTAIVLRPCEAKAVVELVKLRQVDPQQVLIVAVDCVGTHEASEFVELGVAADAWAQRYAEGLRAGASEPNVERAYRSACTRCVDAVAPVADIWLHVIGVPETDEILVEVHDPALAERLGLSAIEDRPGRAPVLTQLQGQRLAKRQQDLDAALQALQPGEDGTPGLAALFDTCLRCLNCGTACPICYCKECLFRTDSVKVDTRHLLDLADRRGAVRLPGDAILYQLTRLMHVSTSCVGCGLCASACPMDLPVDLVFQAVARETQALLEYQPGFDPAQPVPVSTFQREEFETLGEH